MALVRKELVRPDRTQLPGDDAFRFRHLLIRDAAYDGLPKAARAGLHERFADWLAGHGSDLVELDEILGYHLEQAHRYHVELGLAGEATEALARRAAERLGAAAERAALRHDATAAVRLYERTLALGPDLPEAFERGLRLLRERLEAGDLAQALSDADALAERARRDHDRPRELRAQLARASISYLARPESIGAFGPLVEEALEVFGALDDDAGLAEALSVASAVDHAALRWRSVTVALERMLGHAERLGDRLLIYDARARLLSAYMYGPVPVDEAIAWYEAHRTEHPFFLANLGQLEAMRGNIAVAREHYNKARQEGKERGQLLLAASATMEGAEAELVAGDPERAAAIALEGVGELKALGDQGWLSTVAGYAAEALCRLGRDEEAWELTNEAEAAGAPDDVITQMLVRQVRAKLHARRDEFVEAERLAREAVALSEPTDALEAKADAHCDLGIVLGAVGKADEALGALDDAHRLYQEKGHTAGMARTEKLRAELVATLGA
jgi:tetratricopeptide (TPR) repeat protein